MKIEIIKIDPALKRMGFKIGEKYPVIKLMNGKYPLVVTPLGNQTTLLPDDFKLCEENKIAQLNNCSIFATGKE